MIQGSTESLSKIRVYGSVALGYILTWLGYPFYTAMGGDYNAYLIYTTSRLLGYDKLAAEWLVKQSRLETGHWKNPNGIYAKGTNNLFGMRVPATRATWNAGVYDSGTNGKFLRYSCLGQSIADRALRDDNFGIPFADGGYIGHLSRSKYTSDVNYYAIVTSMASGINQSLAVTAVVVYSVLFALFFVYYLKKGKRRFSKQARFGRR